MLNGTPDVTRGSSRVSTNEILSCDYECSTDWNLGSAGRLWARLSDSRGSRVGFGCVCCRLLKRARLLILATRAVAR